MKFRLTQKIIALGMVLFMAFSLAACGDDTPESALGNLDIDNVKLVEGDTYTVMTIRDFGEIKIKLFPEIAPIAVQNFIDLAESGYYDGKIIHRVIEDFMFQGGSPFGDGMSDPDFETFGIEPSEHARHFYGTLAMANAQGRNAQQFYIVNDKEGTPHLDGGYTIFGQTIEGFDVIDTISVVEVGPADPDRPFDPWSNPMSRPLVEIVIESVTIHRHLAGE